MNQPPTARASETLAGRPRSATCSNPDGFTWLREADERVALSGIHARPNTARVHNYLLRGKDNFGCDREFAHHLLGLAPGLAAVLQANRGFVIRAARHLAARRGIRQFLEVGVGYPGQENVHQVAQRIAADTRVVYIDDDPVVLTHARALLATNDRVRVVEGHLRDPGGFMNHRNTRGLIDFTQPVAVLIAGDRQLAALGHEPYRIVAQMREALSPGGYLVISHPVARPETILVTEMFRDYLDATLTVRTKEQIAAFFRGLELEPPGLVSVSGWRPGSASVADGDAWFYAGAGRVAGTAESG